MKTSPQHQHNNAAFSLVEVVIAMAICAMGFVTLLGLLPQGMEMARSSAEMSSQSRIRQKLTGELQSASWEDMTWQGYGPLRYFNDQGIEIPASEVNGRGASTLAYVASVFLPPQPMDIYLPSGGKPSSTVAEPFLRRVKVCIASHSEAQFDFAQAPSRRVRSYATLIAKMGH